MSAKVIRPVPALNQSTLVHYKDAIFVDRETGMVLSRIGHCGLNGYERVWIDGKEERAHRVVWEALNGPIPEGLSINHLDGVKTNNHPSNLMPATQSEQISHAWRIGLRVHNGLAGKPRPSILSNEDRARLLAAPRGTITELSRELGISRAYAYQVRSGRRLGVGH